MISRERTCKQAIYEELDGPWGPQCWLGSNTPNRTETLKKGSRDCSGANPPGVCTDYCFAKNGFL